MQGKSLSGLSCSDCELLQTWWSNADTYQAEPSSPPHLSGLSRADPWFRFSLAVSLCKKISAESFLESIDYSPGLWVIAIAVNGWNFMESKLVTHRALSALSS